MINRKDITNVAKRMLRHHRGLEDPQIIHPQRDWFIGVGVSAIVLALIMFWNINAYIKHSNTNVDGSLEIANTDSVYREGQVKSALEYFSTKENKYNELVGDVSVQPEIIEPIIEEEVPVVNPEVVDVSEEGSLTEEEVSAEIPVTNEEVTPELSE